MTIFFVQNLPHPLAPILDCDAFNDWYEQPTLYKGFGISNKMSISELFVTFFDFYSNFPFDELAVSVHGKKEESFMYASDLELYEKQRRCMIVQDPFDEKDNVARNIRENTLKMFQKEFYRAVEVLISDSPNRLLEAPVRQPTKNQLINKYIRTQKKRGIKQEKFNMKEAKKVLNVSEKRIQRAVDKIYGPRKKRRNKPGK